MKFKSFLVIFFNFIFVSSLVFGLPEDKEQTSTCQKRTYSKEELYVTRDKVIRRVHAGGLAETKDVIDFVADILKPVEKNEEDDQGVN